MKGSKSSAASPQQLGTLRQLLASQSTPQLDAGLPDLDYAFPIRSTPGHGIIPGVRANTRSKTQLASSKSLASLLGRRPPGMSVVQVKVDGEETSSFEAKLQLVKQRPLSQLIPSSTRSNLAAPLPLTRTKRSLIQRDIAAINTAVHECEEELYKFEKQMDPLLFFQVCEACTVTISSP